MVQAPSAQHVDRHPAFTAIEGLRLQRDAGTVLDDISMPYGGRSGSAKAAGMAMAKGAKEVGCILLTVCRLTPSVLVIDV